MFSRAGKTTVSQYLVFSKEKKTTPQAKESDEEDDAVETLLGERKTTDLDYEMRKIQERDTLLQKKLKHEKHAMKI